MLPFPEQILAAVCDLGPVDRRVAQEHSHPLVWWLHPVGGAGVLRDPDDEATARHSRKAGRQRTDFARGDHRLGARGPRWWRDDDRQPGGSQRRTRPPDRIHDALQDRKERRGPEGPTRISAHGSLAESAPRPRTRPTDAAGRLRPRLARLLLSREIAHTPAAAGLAFRELAFTTDDGVQLCGWWIPTPAQDRLGEILFCHGNAGNISGRLLEAQLLTRAGFDILLFDYRGYGHSNGRPDEPGTYRAARAAHDALLAQPEAEPASVIYLGESLGGAVALQLTLERPPVGLILQPTFTSIRDLVRHHYPLIPTLLNPRLVSKPQHRLAPPGAPAGASRRPR